ncbi:caspase family protein [Candidatus Fermentibacterales bacterium]|nr:caspase family protein [Candidatus Fermentibacterales bacterium]
MTRTVSLMLLLWASASSQFIPDAERIPVISRGQTLEVELQAGGSAWVRVLEEDYVSLRLRTDARAGAQIRLVAYDDRGDVLCSSSGGEDLFLSAVSHYWFYVMLESLDPDYSGVVRISLTEDEPIQLGGSTARGSVGLNRMAAHYVFRPGETGEWRIELEGLSPTDLDLEIYGTGNNLWGGSYSAEGSESLDCQALEGEDVLVVVSRYDKSGDGSFRLEARRRAGLQGLGPGEAASGRLHGSQPVRRYVADLSADSPLLLSLEGEDLDADLDLTVRDPSSGEYLYGSASYSASEGVLLPAGAGELVAEVVAFDLGSEESTRFRLALEEPMLVHDRRPPFETGIEASAQQAALVGLAPGAEGLYTVWSSAGPKASSGDLALYREPGGPSVVLSTGQPEEEYIVWIGAADTLWLGPQSLDSSSPGPVTIGFMEACAAALEGLVEGRVDSPEGHPRDFYRVESLPNSILLIEMTGKERESDLDMFVSGPEADVVAAGWISSVDRAGDESVAVYTGEGGSYGITVYAYERAGVGSYTITSRTVPVHGFAGPSAGVPETWALVVGISGYEGSGALNRSTMDAMDFHRFLTEDQLVPEDHVVMLVDRMATLDSFESWLEELFSRAGSEDRAILFFSGHGNQLAPGSGGSEEEDAANEELCLYDGDLSDDDLARLVRSSAAGEVLLFLDACHSGGFVNDFEGSGDLLILAAAAEDNSVSERILTPILLDGSRGAADSNADGDITASELAVYVSARLDRICPFCDCELPFGATVCPECGEVLKGEGAIPHVEQGLFMDGDRVVWR